MHIGYIIDDWETIDPSKSSTLLLIHECALRGHTVSLVYTRSLTVRKNVVHAFLRTLNVPEKIPDSVTSFYKKTTLSEKMLSLHALDALFIRRDPPIDPIVLNFLDSIKDDVVVMNAVDGLRKANNKLYSATFHDPSGDVFPETHVSKNKDYLRRVIRESDGDKMIMKPLDGSGGHGVIVLEKGAETNINSLLDFYIGKDEQHYVIVQGYLEGAELGDIRVLMLNGEMLGAYRRVPPPGELRANIQTGGTPEKVTLTEEQLHLCKRVGPRLAADGLYFVGLDLVGNHLIEINVLNPGGISNINKLNKLKLQRPVIDFVEARVRERQEHRAELEYLLKRFTALRESPN